MLVEQERKRVQLLGRSSRTSDLAVRCEAPLEGPGATIPDQTQLKECLQLLDPRRDRRRRQSPALLSRALHAPPSVGSTRIMIYSPKSLFQPCSSDCSHGLSGNIPLLSDTSRHSHIPTFPGQLGPREVPSHALLTAPALPVGMHKVTVTSGRGEQPWWLPRPLLTPVLQCPGGCSSWSGFSASGQCWSCMCRAAAPPAPGTVSGSTLGLWDPSPSLPSAQESWALSMCLDSSAKGSENQSPELGETLRDHQIPPCPAQTLQQSHPGHPWELLELWQPWGRANSLGSLSSASTSGSGTFPKIQPNPGPAPAFPGPVPGQQREEMRAAAVLPLGRS
ncbi:uncharacterized protein LOC131578715 [Poecile atricapillus]|uniref:uncharacterized protein LOC131578715 n=1 Tax=Poecile atricapillus TaxID=48891 RepID=UPI00273A127C|nr:uncharacterized protein LOC131578715 [Poecile atricapillus]